MGVIFPAVLNRACITQNQIVVHLDEEMLINSFLQEHLNHMQRSLIPAWGILILKALLINFHDEGTTRGPDLQCMAIS